MRLKTCIRPRDVKLPQIAKKYIHSKRLDHRKKSLINHFYHWLQRHQLALHNLEQHHINKFLKKPWRLKPNKETRIHYRASLRTYLYWLYDKGYLKFDPQLDPSLPKRLPAIALQFIESLKPTLKASTLTAYRSSLRKFHAFLEDQSLDLHCLNRTHTSKWLNTLYENGLNPCTRVHNIINTRCYLRWLYDQGLLQQHTDHLIRKTDLPKLPSYLPRPLSPVHDAMLQKHLSKSKNICHLGLLLMRKTGLRIGELRNLPYDCLLIDYHGNRFLKVPLGKLNNERLVPVDDSIYRIIQTIKKTHNYEGKKKWLLQTPNQRQPDYSQYNLVLKNLAHKLRFKESVTSHRLRHTFATVMLNAGMSLVGVMKLLGHRDFRMTLRYAAITQETVGTEYFQALKKIEHRYPLKPLPSSEDFDPFNSMSVLSKWLQKTLPPSSAKRNRLLQKRIQRLREEIKKTIPAQR